jgi:hypothetical protein
MTWLTEGTSNPYWNDYLQRIGGPSHQGGYIGFMRAARLDEQPEIATRSIAELPPSRLFEGTGLAYLHTDLTDSAGNVQVCFKSSPFGKQSHGNEANNHFELYAYGEPLLIRTGTRELHGSPHHREWVWATKSCNSITVNGVGEKPNRSAAVGRVRTFEHTADFDYVVGEAGEAYDDDVLLRYDRHLLFVRPDLIVVMDDLQAPEASSFEYLLHAPVEMQVAEGQQIALQVGDSALSVNLLTPTGLRITQTDEFDTPPQEHIQLDEWHLTAATDEPAVEQQFVALMRPHRAGQSVPSDAEIERTDAGYAVRAAMPDGSVIVLWRLADGDLTGFGLSTDGDLAAIRLDADGSPPRVLRLQRRRGALERAAAGRVGAAAGGGGEPPRADGPQTHPGGTPRRPRNTVISAKERNRWRSAMPCSHSATRAAYDLHLHTGWSYDATATAADLLAAAAAAGVRRVAITDHHVVDGLAEAIEAAAGYPDVTLVCGAEITVTASIGSVDMLCLGFTPAAIEALWPIRDAYHQWQRECGAALCAGIRRPRLRLHRRAARGAAGVVPAEDRAGAAGLHSRGEPDAAGMVHRARLHRRRGRIRSAARGGGRASGATALPGRRRRPPRGQAARRPRGDRTPRQLLPARQPRAHGAAARGAAARRRRVRAPVRRARTDRRLPRMV